MAEEVQGYARPELLAETDWLEEHLDDPEVVIVDCDPWDVYRRTHIRNAVGLRGVHHYIKDAHNFTYVMPPDQFADLMGRLGISNDTLVVAYDGFGGLYACRLWWVLNLYGHTKVKVLNGGYNKWFLEGRPLSIEVPHPTPRVFEPRPQPRWLCTLDDAKARIGCADTVFLDVRSIEEWTGANPRDNRRAGHIPGAIHLEWLNFVTDPPLRTFKPAHELRRMLEERGVTPEKEVITY